MPNENAQINEFQEKQLPGESKICQLTSNNMWQQLLHQSSCMDLRSLKGTTTGKDIFEALSAAAVSDIGLKQSCAESQQMELQQWLADRMGFYGLQRGLRQWRWAR